MRSAAALLVICLLAAAGPAARADDLYAGASTYLDLGHFHTTLQYPDGGHEAHVGQFGVAYSPSGVKDLLHRIGASYHKASGFFLEGGPGRAAEVRAEVSAASA